MSKLTPKIKALDFRPAVLVEQVSHFLTDAILEGVFKGGDQLVETELQKQLGISRSPLREAFRDLEKKGLVEIIPRKGTFVKLITRKDIEEHFPVRATLEGLAAREAHKRMRGEDIEALRRALRGMEEAAARRDAKEFREHHLLFHEVFIKTSGNDVLIGMLRILRMHTMWYRFSYQYYREDFNKSLEVHRKILKLFEDRESDEREIEQFVRDHIEAALDRFLDYLKEQNARPREVGAPDGCGDEARG